VSANVAVRWTAWLPFVMVECSRCSALIRDDPDARANHEGWHLARPLPSNDGSES
jgi:hypothetical protein